MKVWKGALARVAWSGLLAAGFSAAVPAVAAQQAAAVPEKHEASAANPLSVANEEHPAEIGEIPDSPGAVLSKSGNATTQQNAAEQTWGAASSASQPVPAQSSGSQAQPTPQRPVGTAAAEAPNASGVAASEPAGVAIAPAKQRRVRTIVLRVGAIVGAGVAVGSVVALTAATSSKPPGAH